jgi:hypothetical protein
VFVMSSTCRASPFPIKAIFLAGSIAAAWQGPYGQMPKNSTGSSVARDGLWTWTRTCGALSCGAEPEVGVNKSGTRSNAAVPQPILLPASDRRRKIMDMRGNFIATPLRSFPRGFHKGLPSPGEFSGRRACSSAGRPEAPPPPCHPVGPLSESIFGDRGHVKDGRRCGCRIQALCRHEAPEARADRRVIGVIYRGTRTRGTCPPWASVPEVHVPLGRPLGA